MTTILSFILLVISKIGSVAYPLLLGALIKAITCNPDELEEGEACPDNEYMLLLIMLYILVKFLSELVNFLREIPFAYIAANAEKHIAAIVYEHV